MSRQPGRADTAAWRAARAECIARSTDCGLCGYPLRPEAKPRTTWSTEIDHVTPLALGGEPFDQDNLRAVHRRCHLLRPNPATRRGRRLLRAGAR